MNLQKHCITQKWIPQSHTFQTLIQCSKFLVRTKKSPLFHFLPPRQKKNYSSRKNLRNYIDAAAYRTPPLSSDDARALCCTYTFYSLGCSPPALDDACCTCRYIIYMIRRAQSALIIYFRLFLHVVYETRARERSKWTGSRVHAYIFAFLRAWIIREVINWIVLYTCVCVQSLPRD